MSKRSSMRRGECVIDFGRKMGREYFCEQGLKRTRVRRQMRGRSGRRKSGRESVRKSMMESRRKSRRKRRWKRRSECVFDLGRKMGRECPCE